MAEQRTALVTGACGFVGTHLTLRLLSEGYKVIGVDCFRTSHRNNYAVVKDHPNYRLVEHDIIEPIPDELIAEKIDEIYNLACPASPPHYQDDPIWTMKTAFLGVLNGLELARKKNAKFLQASTSEVYGNPLEHPQRETYLGNVSCTGVRACYDEGKRIGETLCFEFHAKYNVQVRVIRIFNTYGPYMHPYDGRVVSNFIRQALAGENLTIFGDGDQTRSFQYVDDLVEGIRRMMSNKQGFIGPVNIGNPNEFTVSELATRVLRAISNGSQISYQKAAADDPVKRRPDISVAERELGWSPKIQLEEGLEKTIEYFRKVNLSDYEDPLKKKLESVQ